MKEWIHLGFTGALYSLCGAMRNDLNPSVPDVTRATCPECLDEHRTNEKAHAALHRGSTIHPTYERS